MAIYPNSASGMIGMGGMGLGGGGGVFQTASSTLSGISPAHQVKVSLAPAWVAKKKSKLEKKIFELYSTPKRELEKVGEYYTSRNGAALNILGDLNPIHGGKPNALAMAMLDCAPSPVRSRKGTSKWGVYTLKNLGLAFFYPVVAGQRCRSGRLSIEGIQLLDHWAKKFKRFRPFVDAYLTKKTRNEIAVLCFDLEMGVLPKLFDDYLAKHEVNMVKVKAKQEEEYRNRLEAEMTMRQSQAVDQSRYWGALYNSTVPSTFLSSSPTSSPLYRAAHTPEELLQKLYSQKNNLFNE